MRGVTVKQDATVLNVGISTHTPHARRDCTVQFIRIYQAQFQLTRLMRGVTLKINQYRKYIKFQLTRLMRGVTLESSFFSTVSEISTHTPHARRDCW